MDPKQATFILSPFRSVNVSGEDSISGHPVTINSKQIYIYISRGFFSNSKELNDYFLCMSHTDGSHKARCGSTL